MPANPYHASGSPKLVRSVLAFMDILGYRAMIADAHESGQQQEMLERLYKALAQGRKGLEDDYIDPKLKELMGPDLYALKAFTDNIVIGWPVRRDAEIELGDALQK